MKTAKLVMKSIYFTLLIGLLVITGSITVGSSPVLAQSNLSASSYLTMKQSNDIPEREPQTDFTCSDQVYAVVEVPENQDTEAKQHELSVFWYNPNDKVEQRTVYDFTNSEFGTRVWAWLRLSGPPGAAIARVFDPAFGMGKFIGEWRAEIKIDNKKVATHSFNVLC